jgi:hypothetical protein
MSSSRLSVGPRRRRRVEDDSDEEDERSARGTTPFSQSSNGSKRPRIETPDETDNNASQNDEHDEGDADRPTQKVPLTRAGLPDGYSTHGDFQPGAIVRIKLKDFVTYTSAEFFPGPKLNMVIGPNGTGKSTLVCAICLGLGWGPQVSLIFFSCMRKRFELPQTNTFPFFFSTLDVQKTPRNS